MLSEAKPALKPDLREAKGNPNRGGGVSGRAIPTAEAVLPEGQSQPRRRCCRKGNPNRGAVLPKGNPNRVNAMGMHI